MVECICGDGTILPPLGIFKGKNVLQTWIPDQVLNSWFFSANTKGWTSNLHGLEWLKRVFEPLTCTKANSQYRLLVCDGHDSYISGSFIAHCLQNRILLMILPPHTSHLLQPLDVAIFGPLQKANSKPLSPKPGSIGSNSEGRMARCIYTGPTRCIYSPKYRIGLAGSWSFPI